MLMKSTPGTNFKMFYEQLLHAQIPKAQKDSQIFFTLLGSGLDFISVLRTAFTPVAPQSVRT
jgi:hypothetical protein